MRVEIDDIEMEIDTLGTTGRPVVLIHGLGGSRKVWKRSAELLARGARVLVPDLRGCGATTRGTSPYSLGRIADDLAAMIARLDLRGVVAVGHSLGGVIAQEILTRHAGVLSGAVLVSTSSRLSEAASQNWKKLAEIVAAKGLSASPAAQARGFSEQFAAEHPEVLAEQAALAATADSAVYAEQAMAASSYDYTDALGGVGVPVLVLQGLADRLTPPGGSVILHRALPGSRLEMIEGAGHNLPIEMPERFARLVLDFVAALPPA